MPIVLLGLVAAVGIALALSGKKDPFAGHATTIAAPGLFDANETPQQASAVQTALVLETDPNKLDAFANALTPEYPNSAKILHARAAALRAAQPQIAPAVIIPPPAAPTPAPIVPPPAAVIPTPAGPAVVPAVVPVPVVPSLPLPLPAPVIPAGPPPFPAPGSTAFVATSDPGAAGDLNIRSGPSTSASVLTTVHRQSTLTITGPNQGGFFPVLTPDGTNGFASGSFLSASDPGPLPAGGGVTVLPAVVVPAVAPGSTGITAVVTTSDPSPAGDLNLRDAPNGKVIGTLPKNATVDVLDPDDGSGWLHVSFGGMTGFASSQFLTVNDSTTSAGIFAAGAYGFAPFSAGLAMVPVYAQPSYTAGYDPTAPELPGYVSRGGRGQLTTGADDPAELANAGAALAHALMAHSCRQTDEPVVRRFQLAARVAGLYAGKAHGSYDGATQAALARVVGPQVPPPCFGVAGGPVNFDDYWRRVS